MLRRVKRPNIPLSGLLRAAARARKNAYAPYSRFPVGAAVLAGGRIFAACNVENSSYPLGMCAERNAVGQAIAAGKRRIDAVAVIAGGARPAAPCGGCRQVLSEFCAPDASVIYASTSGRSVTTDVGSLLPDSFGPANLPKPARGRKNPSRPRARSV